MKEKSFVYIRIWGNHYSSRINLRYYIKQRNYHSNYAGMSINCVLRNLSNSSVKQNEYVTHRPGAKEIEYCYNGIIIKKVYWLNKKGITHKTNGPAIIKYLIDKTGNILDTRHFYSVRGKKIKKNDILSVFQKEIFLDDNYEMSYDDSIIFKLAFC